MICILHGYLLDGSGSNLWTRTMLSTLAQMGETVHIVCQESHPEEFPFVSEAYRYQRDGAIEKFYEKKSTESVAKVILHKPILGDTLPVYVKDRYEEFQDVVPMIELPDEKIDEYLLTNTQALKTIIQDHGITQLHVNHTVLMSVVAERIHQETGIPYVVMPHGSAIEYAVKKDKRMWDFALTGLNHASKIIVISPEIKTRLQNVFPNQEHLDDKIIEVPLGVDTSLFKTTEDRTAELNKLSLYIETLPPGKGKTQLMTQKLVSGFSFEKGLNSHTRYSLKSRDQDLQQKISQIQFPLLIFIGRLIKEKGLHTLLFALPELLKRRPDINLAIVGHGLLREIGELLLDALSRGDGRKTEQLVKWAELTEARHFIRQKKEQKTWNAYLRTAKTHLNKQNVHFLGYLKHAELSPLLSCADIACFPSMVPEAGPLVFLEAMASGCFPMGTYDAGLKASIDRLDHVLPSYDLDLMKIDPNPSKIIQSLISQIHKALEIRRKYRAILRKTAVTQFDWEIIARKLLRSLN